MTPQIIIAGVIAAIGFGSGWHIQALRYTAKEKAHAEQKLAQIQHNAAASIRRADNVILAQNQAAHRTGRLLRDLDSSRSELDRLRDTLRTMPRDDVTTCTSTESGSKRNDVLLECLASYEALARDADLWKNDALMLLEAWPK